MRLIDADRLKEHMKTDGTTVIEKVIMESIDLQPTAYDMDKVIEELEELAKQEDTPKYVGDVEFDLLVGVSDVIEIVKSSCVDK